MNLLDEYMGWWKQGYGSDDCFDSGDGGGGYHYGGLGGLHGGGYGDGDGDGVADGDGFGAGQRDGDGYGDGSTNSKSYDEHRYDRKEIRDAA